MSNETRNKPAHALGPRAMRAIGLEPRAFYADIIARRVVQTLCRDSAQAGRAKQRGEDPMTLILDKQHAEDRIEGQEPPPDWSDDDYAAVDERLVGRIYRQQVQGDIKGVWFLQTVPPPLPNEAIADTLDEPKAALASRYEQVKRGE
jgi:hypothetical protein